MKDRHGKGRIGEFMVSMDVLRRSQVDEILEIQRRGDRRRFGDIARDRGYLTKPAIRQYLDYVQRTVEVGKPERARYSLTKTRAAGRTAAFSAAVLSALYVGIATIYILISSQLTGSWATSLHQLQILETVKGVAFVVVTGTLLFILHLGWARTAQRQRALLIAGERRAAASLYSAALAHDIRNLLMGLSGLLDEINAQTAQSEHVTELGRAVKESMNQLTAFADRIALTARTLQPDEQSEVDLSQALERVGSLAEKHPAVMECTFYLSKPPRVILTLNEQLLEQALLNLIVNAAQAAGRGGTVELTTHPLDGGVAVEVHDNGPGVAPEDLKPIFEAGYTTKQDGAGLGLLSVRAFAGSCSAQLSVDRSHLGGAVFRISIPFGDRMPKEA